MVSGQVYFTADERVVNKKVRFKKLLYQDYFD